MRNIIYEIISFIKTYNFFFINNKILFAKVTEGCYVYQSNQRLPNSH